MNGLRFGIALASYGVLVCGLSAADPLTDIRDKIRSLPGFSRGFNEDAIWESVGEALRQYVFLQNAYRDQGCGCRLKGGGPEAPYAASSDIDPFRNPYIYFMGDSDLASACPDSQIRSIP